jgi:hypothetical protein
VTENDAEKLVFQKAIDASGLTRGQTLTFENEPFDPPAAGTPWVRISVRHLDGGQATLGPNKKYNRYGIVQVNAFAREGTGTGLATRLARQIADLYEGVDLGGVFCDNSRLFPGSDDGTGWWMVVAQVHFQYHHQK